MVSTRVPEQPLHDAPNPWASTDMPSHRDGPPFHMTEMIEAEPALASRLLRRLGDADSPAARLADAVRRTSENGRPIVVTGCGTSEHGAQAVVEILREALRAVGLSAALGRTGTPIAAQAFEAAIEDELGGPAGLVIGISHEGATAATNRSLERARASRATIAIVTVSDRSPGAALADLVVSTGELDESWCHTIGYLSPILAATAVAGHITHRPVRPGSIQAALAVGLAGAELARAERLAAALADVDRLLVVASGSDRPAARELALKVEEGVHLPASMRDLESILHGHLAGTDATTGLVLILADTSPDAEARATRASDVLRAASEIGLRVGAILGSRFAATIAPALTPAGRLVIPPAVDLPPAIAALVGSAVPLQLLTERLARARGTNPDAIRREERAYLRAAETAG
jgi:glucosamine--fructose-6-phosphate aminotransferase (isomerizing)